MRNSSKTTRHQTQFVCRQNYGYSSDYITDDMLCANEEGGGKDACHGDSGSPLVTSYGDGVTPGLNYELIGIRKIVRIFIFDSANILLLKGTVSWGYGCAEADYPGVYGRYRRFSRINKNKLGWGGVQGQVEGSG